jgi:type II secretory pathway pseudopilin PulG
MRRGFGLIQVIFFMVILSTILTITMRYAKSSSKETVDLYVREQAELFAQSAMELALLGIQDHNRSVGCLHEVRVISEDKRFVADINITDYFLYSGDTNPCDRKNSIDTEESNGMILMEMVVETNSSHPKNSTPIRITKRMIQKP